MPVYPVIDSSKLREVAKRVREIEPQIRKDLVSGLKADLKPYADKIAGDVPGKGSPPLSGFVHQGRIRWGGARASTHVTPGGGRGSVARIEIYGPGETKAAFKLVDRAGTRNAGDRVRRAYRDSLGRRVPRDGDDHPTASGDALIQQLKSRFPLSANGKGGRFAWKGFMKYRPMFIDMTVRALDEYAAKATGRILR